jgi:arylsulfatase A-like enzyme
MMFDKMTPDIAPADKSFFSYVLNVTPHAPHFSSDSIFPKRPYIYDANGWWELDTILPDYLGEDGTMTNSLTEVIKLIDDADLAAAFPKITPDTDGINGADKDARGQEIRRAVIAYLTSIYEYDRGVGILLNYLKTTPDIKHDPTEQTMLIDTTALVFYSDHFNYPAYTVPMHTGGGLLSNKWVDAVNGEKLAFFIYNPRDIRDPDDETRIVPRFTSSMDIYPTVAHLFGIPVHTKITLGRSAYDPATVSVGIEYLKGRGFGAFFKTDNWQSFYKTYNTPAGSAIPMAYLSPAEQVEIAVLRKRHDQVLETLSALRELYKIGFDNTPAKAYNMKHD